MNHTLRLMNRLVLGALAAGTLVFMGGVADAVPVVLVSVDGMKPEYVLEAQARGLHLPYLAGLVHRGSYAEGVTGVWPSVTYPSHTTLVTGVSPAVHAIFANAEFDPQHQHADAWYWYAPQIRARTLWQAAHAAQLTTASVGWPVTVGAADVDYLIPEYWRTLGTGPELNPSDRYLIAALARPAGLVEQMQERLGPYMMANELSLGGDEIKARYAIDLIRRQHPALLTLHLSSLDEVEHEHGPFSAQANRTLEAIDGLLSGIDTAARAANPDCVVIVVSDHGFAPVQYHVNLSVAFERAGLLTTAADGATHVRKVSAWKAAPWFAGGMAAVMLADPADSATEARAVALGQALAADPDSGVAAFVSHEELASRGGFPGAAGAIVFRPGYYAGTALAGDLVTKLAETQGGHGYAPDSPQMRAAFFASGRAVAAGRNLGIIDMRQVAPTVARLLGVNLPDAQGAVISLSP